MDIGDLHREFGKSIAEGRALQREVVELEASYRKSQADIMERHRVARDALSNRSNRNQRRTDELEEAIRLTEDAMDPVMAKLKAPESLDERREQLIAGVDITGNLSLGARITSEATARSYADSAISHRIDTLQSAYWETTVKDSGRAQLTIHAG